jgi:hypothetical protein
MASRQPEKRLPWLKWHTRDWRADAPLRMCSYAARGLWIDLLSLMHESVIYGFLLIGDANPTPKQLSGLLGGSEREIRALLLELGDADVYSVTGKPMPEDVAKLVPADMAPGVILSRRMLRDRAKLNQDRENGRGGGNPQLCARKKLPVNPPSNPQRPERREEAPSGLPLKEHQTPFLVTARERIERPGLDVSALIANTVASRKVVAS